MAKDQQRLALEATEDHDWLIRMELPWPPSVNHYFMEYAMPPGVDRIVGQLSKGGRKGFHQWLRKNTRTMKRVGERGHQYRADVLAIVLEHGLNKGLDGPLHMKLRAFPPDRRERDLSNLYKCIEDALEHACVYLSDYQIAAHDSRRELETVKGGLVVVELTPMVF